MAYNHGRENANDVSGKKQKKRFYESVVLTRIPLRKSVSITEWILTQPDGFTAI